MAAPSCATGGLGLSVPRLEHGVGVEMAARAASLTFGVTGLAMWPVSAAMANWSRRVAVSVAVEVPAASAAVVMSVMLGFLGSRSVTLGQDEGTT